MVNYEEIGLRVGLECHQQLQTKHKLFCNCPAKLSDKEPSFTFMRRLRPTQSELGSIDPAALFEFQRGREIIYEADPDTSCLVEMDEEPPHDLNKEAIEIALTVALMMNSTPVDEVHVMRKIVIDGSNTTGFQRTAVIALGGSIEVDGKRIPIQTICLEEDAARKVREEGRKVFYRIDRLGIPLIEVSTEPVIQSPEEAKKVAYEIGRILRATKRVRRGIGTIRQDLNISISGGNLIEIKGVQKLELIPKVVEYEAMRQLNLLKIRDELLNRNARIEDIKEEFVDVTKVFRNTKCRIIRRAIEDGGVVLATKLSKFGGLLKFELQPGLRFGKELADIACLWGGVKGIFHTDEMPCAGISMEEVEELKKEMNSGPDDCIVIVADKFENARDALEAVVRRARQAIEGVPSETRVAMDDGTSRHARPRPGAARLYPETDLLPIEINKEELERIKLTLPRLPSEEIKRLMKEYGINEKLANQIFDSDYLDLFEEIAKSTKVPPSVIAVTLTETLVGLRRSGLNVESLTEDHLREVFKLVDSKLMAKEAIPDVLAWLSKNPERTAQDALSALNIKAISVDELKLIISKILEEEIEFVREKGENSFKKLMGLLMKEVRGRIDAGIASKILREELMLFLDKLKKCAG